MTKITQHFPDQDSAFAWIEDQSFLDRNELYAAHGSDELHLTASYPSGWYTAECGEVEVECNTGGGDHQGPYTRLFTEWVFEDITHHTMPDYMAPLSELFASFNNIFGGKR